MYLGVHVSSAGKIYSSIDRVRELGCNTMQIFSRNPQRRRDVFLAAEDIKEFNERRKGARINPVFIHIPYVVNLASPDKKLLRRSIKVYIEDIKEAYRLNADYIVTHMGSHKNTSESEGLTRLIEALDIIIEKTAGTPVKILLENVSGSGSWIGYKFVHHRQIMKNVKNRQRLGICFDTAHAYSAGYNIASKRGLSELMEELDELVGLDSVKLIHLNDTKDKIGSRRDRHEHIGKGKIGLEGIRRIVNEEAFKDVAFILETPKDSDKSDKINLELVRSLRV